MYCQWCGHELPEGARSCPNCSGSAPGAGPSGRDEKVDRLVSEAKRATRELASATAKLSKSLIQKASQAAKDPSGSARKASRKVAEELDHAAKELDRILRDL